MLVHRTRSAAWLVLALGLAVPAVAHAASDTALRLMNSTSSNTGYVRGPNSAAFSLQTFTLEAWVQRVGAGYGFTTDAGGAGVITKPAEGTVGDNLVSWHLGVLGTGAVLLNLVHTINSSGLYIETAPSATPLARHHIAATFDGATAKIYVDGVLGASGAWTLGSVYYGANDVLLGADNFGAGYYRRFDGFIDDVRIWDHARTAAQVADDVNCRLTGHEAGLVAYWPFDDSTLVDATGHGHNGAAVATTGAVDFASLAALGACTAGVRDPGEPATPALAMAVYPEPARGRVTLSFDLPGAGEATVDVLDVAGRRLAVWASGEFAAGRHELTVDPAAAVSRGAGSGVLFVRLRSGGRTTVRTLVLRR